MRTSHFYSEITQLALGDLGLEGQINCGSQGKFNGYLAHLVATCLILDHVWCV